MNRTAIASAACLAALTMSAAPAQAQLRPDQPRTLPAPSPQADPSLAIVARFRSAYAAAGSPRIVVFWNREFSDEIASEYEDRQTEHEVESTTSNSLEETTRGPAGDAVRGEASNVRERAFEAVQGTKRVRPAQRAHLGTEAVDWQLEQAFTRELQGAGAMIVDRTAALRLTGSMTGAGERANVQDVETLGMNTFADLMLEVLQSPDSRAPDGVTYRVLVRDLRNAQTIATFVSAGRPQARRMPYVAGPSGFVRASAPEPGPSQVGAQLALETMGSMAGGLPQAMR